MNWNEPKNLIKTNHHEQDRTDVAGALSGGVGYKKSGEVCEVYIIWGFSCIVQPYLEEWAMYFYHEWEFSGYSF